MEAKALEYFLMSVTSFKLLSLTAVGTLAGIYSGILLTHFLPSR